MYICYNQTITCQNERKEMQMQSTPVKRLNATLPESLAQFVAQMTGEHGLYETPSEFVRDLIRRHMEKVAIEEKRIINAMLRQAITENDYTPYTAADADAVRASLKQA
jgi:antitoxin ParD1/3/4